MKKLVLALLMAGALVPAFAASAYQSPGRPSGFVSDFAGVLSPAEKEGLEAKLSSFAQSSGVQISVATVASLGGDTVENFAEKLFKEWGIGAAGKDDGALLLVAPAEREIRIEVGYGLEPVLTDAASSRIVRTAIVPAFERGSFIEGLQAGTDAMMAAISGGSGLDTASSSAQQASSINWAEIAVIIAIIVIMSTRRGRRLLPYIFLSGIGRGGFGGGRGGGGFGGFGGGRSGGGGASGKW